MKLQKIKSLCTKSANISVYEAVDCQWIGDGHAIYPVYNLPKLSDEQIFALFDILEDKKGKVRISRNLLPAVFNFDDIDPQEKLLERLPISVGYIGKALLPLIGSDQHITYINAEHLTPFADLKEGYGLYLRSSSSGLRYVAVKKGMLLIGIILPFKAERDEVFANSIANLFISVSDTRGGNSDNLSVDEEDDEQEQIGENHE